jgi:hypothetical protein
MRQLQQYRQQCWQQYRQQQQQQAVGAAVADMGWGWG